MPNNVLALGINLFQACAEGPRTFRQAEGNQAFQDPRDPQMVVVVGSEPVWRSFRKVAGFNDLAGLRLVGKAIEA